MSSCSADVRNEHPQKRNSIFSFFSGAGFLDLGFEHAGFDVVFANEIHRPFAEAYVHARKALNLQLPENGVSVTSIDHYLTGEPLAELQSRVRAEGEKGALVGFIGGPPCPDFSVGGKNRGHEGDNGRLSKSYIDLICLCQPDFFVFENVKGLWRTARHRAFFEQLKLSLDEAGYALTEKLINSIEYGAPQDRDRIILFGVLKKHVSQSLSITFPWEAHVRYSNYEVRKLPWPKTGTVDLSDSELPRELTVSYWFEKNQVENHPNSLHAFTPRAGLAKFLTIEEGDDSRKSYKRLHRHRFSPTVAYGNNEVHIHPTLPRRLSVAEALSLQSLPKEFELPATMTLSNMFKTVGNGVPYLAALGLAKTVSDFLANSSK